MDKKLRIFVDAHCFDGGFQGIRSFIKGIYAALPLPDDVSVYLGAHDIENLKREFPNIPPQNFIRYKYRHAFFRLGFEIPCVLKKYKFDYAHFQYISPVFNYCKYIVTTHDILFEEFRHEFPLRYRMMRSFLFKICLKKAHIKTTPSQYCWERITDLYHIHPEELHIIPNGVDNGFFSVREDQSQASEVIEHKYRVSNFILYVSRIEPRKNHQLLLESFLELELYKQGVSLVFIGESALQYRAFAERLSSLAADIRRFIRCVPSISQQDLIYFYQAARLMVYPSKAEGFGIPPLEAAALRTPVLCANTTAMEAFTFFNRNLFDPTDKAEFKHKLARALFSRSNEAELRRVSELIKDGYSWERSRELLWECLRSHERTSVQD